MPKIDDRPAKFIRKITEERDTLAARVRVLEVEAATVAERTKMAIDDATTAIVIAYEADMKNAVDSRDAWAKDALENSVALGNALRETVSAAGQRDRAVRALEVVEMRNAELVAKIDELWLEIDLLAEQRAELQHICDGVRDRMRRREAEAETAVLNRRVLTAVTLKINRG